MIRVPKSDAQLTAEAAARRVELKEERAAHEATRTSLRAANRMLLGLVLADRMAHPADLELYVPLERLTDQTGQLVWSRVLAVVGELLEARPHLAAPTQLTEPNLSDRGAKVGATGRVEVVTFGPGYAAQGATRSEPGAGADESRPMEFR